MIRDLTDGSIIKNILKVSLPVMGSSLFQMAYQIIDMYFLGKLSSNSVAAVGTAGFYIGISYAIASVVFIGVGIKVSHCVGEKKYNKALEYVISSFITIIIISCFITAIVLLFRINLISFFKLDSEYIFNGALSYLTIIMLFSVFNNLNMTFNRIFIGYGSGKLPLIVGSIALIINIILDPILIFKLDLGINGAAYATVISQLLTAIIYTFMFIKESRILSFNRILFKISHIKDIIKISYPVTIQRLTFTTISLIIGKIISNWGADAIAIQKIGVQLESISWITAGGMQAAITSFIGQNYGAKKIDRLKDGYKSAILIMFGVGLFVSLLFLIFPKEIFSLFVSEPEVIQGGIIYLRILAISQIFMCIDITTMGAFNGLGKTGIPPIVSISLTSFRIPLSLFLSTTMGFGIIGVWFSISITTVFKGIILSLLFILYLKKLKQDNL